MTEHRADLQQVFDLYIDDYLAQYRPSQQQLKVISAIRTCRTAKLGGHVDRCDECGSLQISYNSCGNRYCNKCQTMAKENWLNDRRAELLNTGYFHTVFTVPAELNPIFLRNRKLMYDLLFRVSAGTVMELCQSRQHLGGQPGITSILHTWGQNLQFHPHIHQIIPGGVLTPDRKWRKTRDRFFLPVKALSRKFRGKFLHELNLVKDDLVLNGDCEQFQTQTAFQAYLSTMYAKEWVVYSKPPFKSARHVLEYLGRYTHRVAISNQRILSYKNGTVTFQWRDYRDSNRQKIMTLPAVEFIRRILMHVLPERFMKIRHYGFLSNPQKKTRLKLAQRLTRTKAPMPSGGKLTAREIMLRVTGIDICRCRQCGGNLTSYNIRASPDGCNLILLSPCPAK